MSVIKKTVDKISLIILPPLFKWITRLLFMTCRMHDPSFRIVDEFEAEGKPFIVAYWHYSIIFLVQRGYGRGKSLLAMVSASKDGDFIARIVESMGFVTARGSSNKGGLAALKQMIRIVKEKGLNSIIIADGSQGPARKAQAGAILLASKTGVPIIPMACGTDRYIAFKSWDRTVLPKPFAKIEFVCGEPLEVPARIKSEQIEEYRRLLEERLNDIYKESWGRFDIDEH